jgi:hypothetical protein
MAIRIKIAKWLKYEGNMHWVDGSCERFIAVVNRADVSFPWVLFAEGLELALALVLLEMEIKL